MTTTYSTSSSHICTAVVSSLVALLLFGVSAGISQEAVPRVQPVVQSASEIDYPPFCIVTEDGRADGFSVELLRAALAAMGRTVTFRTGPWHEVKSWLAQGEVDALPLVGRTPEREEAFDFTFPYMSLHGAIVVRKDTRDIRTLDDLKGRHVVVMANDNAEEFMRREERGIVLHTTPTFEQALQELSQGRYDAVVVQRLVALRLIKEAGLSNLHVINTPIEGFRQDFCFAVKRGDRDNLALLNEGLALVMADGTYRHLHVKWFAALELPAGRHLIIGGDHDLPPYEYIDENGNPAGYIVELTRAIARELDLDIEIRLGPWADIVQGLENGEVDAIQGIVYTPERDLKYRFTPPHSAISYVGVVRAGEGPPPSDLKDLAGKRIVVQQDDVLHEILRENGLASQISTVSTQAQVLQELARGQYDCGIVIRRTALYLIAQNEWDNLVVGRKALCSFEYCYAVHPDQTALLAELAEGLQLLNETGEYRAIHEKWLGVDDKPPSLLDVLRYVLMVAVPLLLLLMIFSLWSWSLRRQVAVRTGELRESEERYRVILDHSSDLIWSMNPDGIFTYVSPSWKRVTGYDPDTINGTHFAPLVHPDDVSLCQNYLVNILQEKGTMEAPEYRVRHADDSWHWHSTTGTPVVGADGKVHTLVGVTHDVTQRKQAEMRLEESRQKLSSFLNVSSDLVFVLDAQQRFVEWYSSQYDEKKLFLPPDEFIGKSFDDIMPREIAARFQRCIDEVGNGAKPSEMEYQLTLGGEMKWFRARINSMRSLAENAGDGYIVTIQDITSHRQAEEALHKSEEQFRTLVESSPDAIYVQTNFRFAYVNRTAVELFGAQSPDDLLETPVLDRFHPDFHEKIRKRILGLNEKKQKAPLMEQVYRRLDGSEVPVEVTAVPIHYEGHDGALVFSRDISEKKILESQLQHIQKMESVGRLAGGVAHDFNNMLSIIIGQCDLALMRLESNDPFYGRIKEIEKAARRSALLTQQLLAFARKQTISPTVLNLNETVASMLEMLRRLLGEDINFAWLPERGLWPVRIDPAQVDQILTNLCVNARDAIIGVGKLTIETKNVVFDEEYCATHVGFKPGEYVMLAVSDDGHGMDKETLENIFEPFYTTKDIGQGTGLGLSTVHGIVSQNSGFINVYSEVGQGSSFRIYLPRHVGEEALTLPERIASVAPSRGEVVLLVEDDSPILETIQMMLQQLGYSVMATDTPHDCIKTARELDHVDLLLTDVVMPEMNGRTLSEKLQEIHPEIKCLFMSGYTANVIAHQGILEDELHFIQKPISFADLARKIRDVLDEE